MSQILVGDQTVTPYRSVVYIESTFSNGTTIAGSGVMVGANDVLTVSHLLYVAAYGGAATSVKVIPAYDPSPYATPYGAYTSTSFHYFSNFDPDGDGSFASGDLKGGTLGGSELDIGLIDLSSAVGNDTGWMRLDPAFTSGTVTVTGHPSNAGFNMTTVSGTAQQSTVDSTLFFTGGIDLYPGNSGGPVWYQAADGTQNVVAVVSTARWGADLSGTVDVIRGWITGNDYLIAAAAPPAPPPPTPPIITTPTPPGNTSPPVAGTTLTAGATDGDDFITGSYNPDVLYSGAGNDRIYALEGNDHLAGGAGNDELDGGAGNDVLDGGSGDNSIAGGPGIDVAVYGARAAYDIAYMNGSYLVSNLASGAKDTLSGVERIRFSDSLFLTEPVKTQVDFGSDGRGDVLLHNVNTGAVQMRHMNGTVVGSTETIAYVPSADWHIMGTGDFNGDGHGDILWRHDSGMVGVWHMNGSQFAAGGDVVARPAGWNIVGTGDFDGDHKSEILWRSDEGAIGLWDRQLVTTSNGGIVNPLTNDWKVAGTGDFNGDGKSDVLWQHETGTVAVWLMDGLILRSGGVISSTPNSWMAGTGDFNADNKTDILWRHENGDVGLWLMNGTVTAGGGPLGNVSNDWTIVGVGDFNADRRTDILWQDMTGTLRVDLMDGVTKTATGNIGTVGSDWIVA